MLASSRAFGNLFSGERLYSNEKILEIGTGSGYLTAIFSRLSRKVYTLEKFKTLYVLANNNFKKFRNNLVAYSQKVVKRFEDVLNNPAAHSVGRFDPKDPNVATGMTGAPACGDVMKLQLKLDHEERIVDVKFKTYGCGSAIASSTMFVDMLKGKTIEEAKLIKDKDIATALELPAIKLHCSVLAEDSIRQAIKDWEQKTIHRKHNYYK